MGDTRVGSNDSDSDNAVDAGDVGVMEVFARTDGTAIGAKSDSEKTT